MTNNNPMEKSYGNYNFVHVAELYETIDKYNAGGKHPFFIKALAPLEFKEGRDVEIDRAHIANQDKSWLSNYQFRSEITIDLEIPSAYTSDYPSKYIKKGTKFLVLFVGGSINNAKIIGRA